MKKINTRRFKYGANNTVLIVGAIVIFVLFNLLAGAFSEKFPAARLDLTRSGIFKIGNTTKSVLADLDKTGDNVTVYYLKNTSEEDIYVKEVLLKYLAASENLKYEVKYYVKDPNFMKQFGDVGELTEGGLIITDEETSKYRVIEYEEMFEYSEDYQSQSKSVDSANLESKLTNALAYVISRDDVKAYFVTGHGEADPNEMGGVLVEENITAELFDLKTGDVPDDCGILLVISPVLDFTADEIDRIDNYMDKGGNMQLAVEPAVELPRLESYLKEWGVTLNNDNVVESDPRYMLQDSRSGMVWVYPRFADMEMTKDIGNKTVLGILCRSVSVEDVPTEEISHKSVFYTTKNGISANVETDERSDGVFDLAVLLEKTVGESYDKTARLLVSGSSSFWGATNYNNIISLSGLLSEPSYGNNSFFVGSVFDMAGLGGTKLTISGKSLKGTKLVMTEVQQNMYRIIFCFALPIVIVVLGVVIWLRRRHL